MNDVPIVGTPHSYGSPFCKFFEVFANAFERRIPPPAKAIPHINNSIRDTDPMCFN